MIARERFAVVGGGMLGMTLARRLAQAGHDVSLFEAAPNLGGLASAWQLGDVVWDRHYHVTLLSDSNLRALLGELGLESELRWVTTKTGFYTDGQLYSLSNVLEFLAFPPLGLTDKLRLAATILHASRVRRWQELEDIPVADWLTRLSGKRTFEKIWLPLLRAKLGENYRQTSAAFIWAVIARMYAARRTGLKKEMFGYMPGGYARILERFERVLRDDGVRIEPAQPVESIRSSARGVDVAFPQRTRGALRSSRDHDACAHRRDCLPAAQRRRGDAPARHPLSGHRLRVCPPAPAARPYYVTNITDPWVPFTAVIEMSALVDRSHFGGNSLVYLPKYLPSDDPAFGVPDEQIEAGFLQALERMYPSFSRDDVLSFRISRARYVLPISTLGYSRRLPPVATSVPGVFIVNSAHIVNGTLNVNETVQLANATVPQLLAPRGPMDRAAVEV